MSTLWIALLTGLTTGGISCLAVQGGLLASALAPGSRENKKQLVFLFLLAKLAVYTLLGLALGAAGQSLFISPQIQGYMQILAGLYMVITAMVLLDVHPLFRHFVIKPPKKVIRFVRKSSKVESGFAPAILGAMTVLIPCGVTQSMMLLAVASGNAVLGAGIMLFFTLGTSPIFAVIGLTATKIVANKKILSLASIIILVLGFISINTGQILRGSVHTFGNYKAAIFGFEEQGVVASVNANGIQEVTIDVSQHGYQTSSNTIKSGVPVELTLNTKDTYSCAIAFTIPKLGISKVLEPTGSEKIVFTPDQKGKLVYSCSMGMYSGSFNVI